ncbi:hypothetical protein PR048_023726 [Dryococelus australis]|uniref:Uncharacterized protein n=1 Tax=Dryococelus australis TaxID=614101 RepID=A0ABQ9GUW3_9NEOP|nr:hypothetical protein PR048_023726 [Dryococelus australis]
MASTDHPNKMFATLDADLSHCGNTNTTIAGDFNTNIREQSHVNTFYNITCNCHSFNDHILSNIQNLEATMHTISNSTSDHCALIFKTHKIQNQQ